MTNWIEALRALADDPMKLVIPLVVFAITCAVGWFARRRLLRAIDSWSQRSQSRAGRIIEKSLRGPTWIWIVMLALSLAIQSSPLPDRVVGFVPALLLDLWIISLTLMSMRMARNLVQFYGSQVAGATPVTTLTQNLAQFMVLILGLLVILGPYVARLTGVLTALGVGGLAVALALQDTLSNLFAGFYVAMTGQIRLGDYIKLNSGEEGYITDIGWRSTIIRHPANNLVVIPNATLGKANVTNYHLPEPRMGSNLVVMVALDSDADRVESILLDVVTKSAAEIVALLSDPPPNVQWDPGFGEYFLGFTVNYQVAEFLAQGAVRNELRKRIWRRFREEGIQMPVPSRMLYMKPEGDGSHQ